MNRNVLVFICLVLIEQILTSPTEEDRTEIYLPMKKDHKYGDDICYYREINEKLDYAVYYVRPCEKGQYCKDEVSSNQPFGFCRDIETNITDFSSFGEACSTNAECPDNMICSNGKCKKQTDCPASTASLSFTEVQTDYGVVACRPSDYKQFDENKYCEWSEGSYTNGNPKTYTVDGPYYGKFPGLPKECGIIRFKSVSDVDPYTYSGSTYKSFTRYFEEGREWCTIGEAKDGDFVSDSRFCKSGFSLLFYPNGDIVNPSLGIDSRTYTETIQEMCVTPTQIDFNNPLLSECLITYKGGDGNEHKYNVNKVYGPRPSPPNSAPLLDAICDKDIIIKSQIYSEFIDEFNNATEEDKKDCYRIPQGIVGNCQNVKLLKLYYFYNNVEEYLFYKDRKDLEKVLHYKIQQKYHRYYELSNYLNLNYLFFFLILILL